MLTFTKDMLAYFKPLKQNNYTGLIKSITIIDMQISLFMHEQ